MCFFVVILTDDFPQNIEQQNKKPQKPPQADQFDVRHSFFDILRFNHQSACGGFYVWTMKRKGWSARIVLRYALFQLPFTGLILVALMVLRKWLDIPIWFIYGLIGFLVMKDIALFPLVWRSYDPDSPARTDSLQGARGKAVENLNPSGYVEVGAQLWKAEIVEGGSPVRRGERVRVCSVRGLTLLVQLENERNQ